MAGGTLAKPGRAVTGLCAVFPGFDGKRWNRRADGPAWPACWRQAGINHLLPSIDLSFGQS
jgi:hypothetical protein